MEIINSEVGYVGTYDNSRAIISNSTIIDSIRVAGGSALTNNVEVYRVGLSIYKDNSDWVINNLTGGYYDQWNLYDFNTIIPIAQNLTLTNTNVSNWYVGVWSDGTQLTMFDSNLLGFSVAMTSTAHLINTSVKSWTQVGADVTLYEEYLVSAEVSTDSSPLSGVTIESINSVTNETFDQSITDNTGNSYVRILSKKITSDTTTTYPEHIIRAIYRGQVENIRVWPYGSQKVTFEFPLLILIDGVTVSDERCDIGTTQTVSFHAVWDHNKSDIKDCAITVGDELGFLVKPGIFTNNMGWAEINVVQTEVIELQILISDVRAYGVSNYEILIDYPTIIWDTVEITVEPITRQDVSSDSFLWNGKYIFNDETFQGSIILNDTLSNKDVGKYGYRVMGIYNSKYDLTTFQANDFQIIFDNVILNISLTDNRIDIGEEPEIAISGIYEYNSQPFIGSISSILDFPSNVVSEYPIRVNDINDPLYGVTSFTQNEVTCIWDQVIVELSLSDDRIDVGEEPDVSYTAYYEFDSQPFIGEISLTTPDSIDENRDFTYSVEHLVDSKFGLTAFSVEDTLCVWDRVKIIDGGVSKEETTVKKTEIVWFKAEYEYDSADFEGSNGILYVNDEAMEWSSSNQRWEKEYSSDSPETIAFQITGMRDDTYGLTAFNDAAGEQSIEWKQAGIPGFSLESIVISMVLTVLVMWFMRRQR